MKKKSLYLLLFPLCISITACNNSNVDDSTSKESLSESQIQSEVASEAEETYYYGLKAEDASFLSNVHGRTDDTSKKVFRFKVSKTDSYYLCCYDAKLLEIFDKDNNLLAKSSDDPEMLVNLTKGDDIYAVFTTDMPNKEFNFEMMLENGDLITLPYELNAKKIEWDSNKTSETDPLKADNVNYVKRNNGTYIYCNNPEKLASEDVGVALQKNSNLSGEIYFTLEHSNFTSQNIYLGYKVKNETEHDVYVTVKNVGYQYEGSGSWLGEHAWADFYNTQFKVPQDYGNGVDQTEGFKDYNFDSYQPRIYIPTTYCLPSGESFYVMGGTTSDAYNNINIDNTANRSISQGKCINGNVLFDVKGGTVTGTLYCYANTNQVKDDLPYQGYITYRGDNYYGGQYKGIGYHAGVVDNNLAWEFNDKTEGTTLPVDVVNKYDSSAKNLKEAFAAYNSVDHQLGFGYNSSWLTHFNPQAGDNTSVGTDMVAFNCNLPDGTPITLDNEHAGADGMPGNFGNWMIEYQDNFTFMNSGDHDRKVKLSTKDNGCLAMLVRDENGEVLKADYTFGRLPEYGENGYFTYEVTVKAHSKQQITLDYCLVANGNGGVRHKVDLYKI